MNGPEGADRKFYMIPFISFIFKSFFHDLGRLFQHTPQRINIAGRDDIYTLWAKKLVFRSSVIGCGSWKSWYFCLKTSFLEGFDWLRNFLK